MHYALQNTNAILDILLPFRNSLSMTLQYVAFVVDYQRAILNNICPIGSEAFRKDEQFRVILIISDTYTSCLLGSVLAY